MLTGVKQNDTLHVVTCWPGSQRYVVQHLLRNSITCFDWRTPWFFTYFYNRHVRLDIDADLTNSVKISIKTQNRRSAFIDNVNRNIVPFSSLVLGQSQNCSATERDGRPRMTSTSRGRERRLSSQRAVEWRNLHPNSEGPTSFSLSCRSVAAARWTC